MPLFFGCSASMAHLPSERLSIAVSTTEGPAAEDGHTAHVISQRIAAALHPGPPHPRLRPTLPPRTPGPADTYGPGVPLRPAPSHDVT
ncbi:hypothetical protein [Streptomyces sp. NPDC126514]|uniref:hypothetical protein n=1 Tax=Streptomyces sp. NPDC126514 TaxID=3155210 RepID=UPI00331CDF9E